MSTHRRPGEHVERLSVGSAKFSSLFARVGTVYMVSGSGERLSHCSQGLLQLINPSATVSSELPNCGDAILVGVLFALPAGEILEGAFPLLCLAALARPSVGTALALDLELLASLAGPDALACCAAAVLLGRCAVSLRGRGGSVAGAHRAANDSQDSWPSPRLVV